MQPINKSRLKVDNKEKIHLAGLRQNGKKTRLSRKVEELNETLHPVSGIQNIPRSNKPTKVEQKCNCCGERIHAGEEAFFHSRCCNAHFEGRIVDGEFIICCEDCGSFVGFIDKIKTDEYEKAVRKNER